MAAQPSFVPFVTLDVFTSTPFKGNPLAVVLLPPTSNLQPTQAQLQTIAQEFNLSETIFLEHRTAEDIDNENQRARIFTTQREILFAGHPTIGATSWCLVHDPNIAKSSPVKSLTPGGGLIPISLSSATIAAAKDDRYVRALIPHNVRMHEKRIASKDIIDVHPSVAPYLSHDQLEQGIPVVSIVQGMTAVLVQLPTLEALAAITTSGSDEGIRGRSTDNGGYLDQGWGYEAYMQFYFYVRNVTDDKVGNDCEVIRSRMMVRGIEDPATGSGASALTSYIGLTEFPSKGIERKWMVVQGVEMGRRSEIGVQLVAKDDGKGIESIELSGCAVVVSKGEIRI